MLSSGDPKTSQVSLCLPQVLSHRRGRETRSGTQDRQCCLRSAGWGLSEARPAGEVAQGSGVDRLGLVALAVSGVSLSAPLL